MKKLHIAGGFTGSFILILLLGITGTSFLSGCKKEESKTAPVISWKTGEGYTPDGSEVSIGHPVRFGVRAERGDANITNFTVKIISNGVTKTVMDFGMNSTFLDTSLVFYQGVEEDAVWSFSVMDKNRKSAALSCSIHRDMSSSFGPIAEYSGITLGMDKCMDSPAFLSTLEGITIHNDTVDSWQQRVDMLAYFKYSIDNGVNMPSPTFSSPGEEGDAVFDYYPQLAQWVVRNATLYDIREINGVTSSAWQNCHNDSLLIVSYDAAWGKRKYKWVKDGLFIPFITDDGRKGIINVVHADTVATGVITFDMKIQQTGL